jgi:hypothetical protein
MLRLILAAFLIATPFTALAEGTIQIAVKLTPAGSFVAKSDRLKGDLARNGGDITSAKLSVALDSFKTGMSLRDEHFCKHLGCEAQPKAVLTGMKASGGKGSGSLELNGVKKDISFQYEEKDSNFVAKFDLNSTDFKMIKAKYLGIEVAETVSVEVRVPAPKK